MLFWLLFLPCFTMFYHVFFYHVLPYLTLHFLGLFGGSNPLHPTRTLGATCCERPGVFFRSPSDVCEVGGLRFRKLAINRTIDESILKVGGSKQQKILATLGFLKSIYIYDIL